MGVLSPFETQRRSEWVKGMLKWARYPGTTWQNKALWILENDVLEFDYMPTGRELQAEIEELIGPVTGKYDYQLLIHRARKAGLIKQSGSKRRNEKGRHAYPEYLVGRDAVSGGVCDDFEGGPTSS